MRYLIALMRLATCLKYVEKLQQLPDFTIQTGENNLTLDFPEGWLEQHPLTAHELAQEQRTLTKLGLQLAFS